MLDGIRLSGELTAVVALGFTASGQKVILDLEIGASGNETVCRGLVVADWLSRTGCRGLVVADH